MSCRKITLGGNNKCQTCTHIYATYPWPHHPTTIIIRTATLTWKIFMITTDTSGFILVSFAILLFQDLQGRLVSCMWFLA